MESIRLRHTVRVKCCGKVHCEHGAHTVERTDTQRFGEYVTARFIGVVQKVVGIYNFADHSAYFFVLVVVKD